MVLRQRDVVPKQPESKETCGVIFSKEGRCGEIIGIKLRHECFLIQRFGNFLKV